MTANPLQELIDQTAASIEQANSLRWTDEEYWALRRAHREIDPAGYRRARIERLISLCDQRLERYRAGEPDGLGILRYTVRSMVLQMQALRHMSALDADTVRRLSLALREARLSFLEHLRRDAVDYLQSLACEEQG